MMNLSSFKKFAKVAALLLAFGAEASTATLAGVQFQGTIVYQAAADEKNRTAAEFRVAVEGRAWNMEITPKTGNAIQHEFHAHDGKDTYKYIRLKPQPRPPAADPILPGDKKLRGLLPGDSPRKEFVPEDAPAEQAAVAEANTGIGEARSGNQPAPGSLYALLLWLALVPNPALDQPEKMLPAAWPGGDEDMRFPVAIEFLSGQFRVPKEVTFYPEISAGAAKVPEGRYTVEETMAANGIPYPKRFKLSKYLTEAESQTGSELQPAFWVSGETTVVETIPKSSLLSQPKLPQEELTFITDKRAAQLANDPEGHGYMTRGIWKTSDGLAAQLHKAAPAGANDPEGASGRKVPWLLKLLAAGALVGSVIWLGLAREKGKG